MNCQVCNRPMKPPHMRERVGGYLDAPMVIKRKVKASIDCHEVTNELEVKEWWHSYHDLNCLSNDPSTVSYDLELLEQAQPYKKGW